MKKILLLIGLFSVLSGGHAVAQTKVVKVTASKTNDYGVQYALPKTILKVTFEYSEIRQKAGVYARYASRYLGVNDAQVTMTDQTYYTPGKVTVRESGVPNKDQSYLVAFKSKTTAPFVYLTEDGLICAINAEYTAPKPGNDRVGALPASSNLPEINPQSIYTEEYLRAGSVSKMAEVAAKNIYRLRENRQDLLTGEMQNVPKDGEAMKIILANLDAQEKLWTELFTGTSETVPHSKEWTIEPVGEVEKEVFFRFSKYLGVVDADDLSGQPVYWDLRDLKTVDILPFDPKKKAKEPESIVYNVPGKAEINIYTATEKFYSSTLNITQFGTTEILVNSLFEDKKAPVQVLFYPFTGNIRQIIQ